MLLKLGPVLVRDLRQVTPDSFSCCKPLIDSLITKGLSTSVMEGQKFSEALRDVLKDYPSWAGDDMLPDTIDRISMHMRIMLMMMREAKHEELNQYGRQRYPRTGGFRRKLAKAGMTDMLLETISMIDLDGASSRCSSPASTITYQDMDEVDTHEKDEWPSFHDEASIVVVADSNDWPNFDDGEGDQDLDDSMGSIIPMPARRKRAIKQDKKDKKDGAKHKKDKKDKGKDKETGKGSEVKSMGKGKAIKGKGALGCSKCRYLRGGCGRCRTRARARAHA